MSDEVYFEQVLQDAQTRFGDAPRRFGFWRYFFGVWMRVPAWLPITDGLFQIWLHQRRLINDGDVVWGCLVQANQAMFRWGLESLPGDVIYCSEPGRYVSPGELAAVAHRAYALKGEIAGSPGEQAVADHLANELERVFGLVVPRSLSPRFDCALSTLCFDRWHLPGMHLARSFFPLIVSRTDPKVVMVLPSCFWSDSFRKEWKGR
ncbi:MAG: hypothetical protein H8F28_24885 [Fibrella sp.]|nr:hypothetical protein [Armatimonadota bacterium]